MSGLGHPPGGDTLDASGGVFALLHALNDPASVKQRLDDLNAAQVAHDQAAEQAQAAQSKLDAARKEHERAIAAHEQEVNEFQALRLQAETRLAEREDKVTAREQAAEKQAQALQERAEQIKQATADFDRTYGPKLKELSDREAALDRNEQVMSKRSADLDAAERDLQARKDKLKALIS